MFPFHFRSHWTAHETNGNCFGPTLTLIFSSEQTDVYVSKSSHKPSAKKKSKNSKE